MRRMIPQKQIEKLETSPNYIYHHEGFAEEDYYEMELPTANENGASIMFRVMNDGTPLIIGRNGNVEEIGLGQDEGDFIVYIDKDGLVTDNIRTSKIIALEEDGSIIFDEHGITVSSENDIILLNLPTSDPHVANALWNDNGVLKISSGN